VMSQTKVKQTVIERKSPDKGQARILGGAWTRLPALCPCFVWALSVVCSRHQHLRTKCVSLSLQCLAGIIYLGPNI
jgi:hypothetical protein